MNPEPLHTEPLVWYHPKYQKPRNSAMIVAVRRDLFRSRLAGQYRIETEFLGDTYVVWSLYDADGTRIEETPERWAYLPDTDTRPLCDVLAHDAYWANWREGTVC
jgi:hypothetical protein